MHNSLLSLTISLELSIGMYSSYQLLHVITDYKGLNVYLFLALNFVYIHICMYS